MKKCRPVICILDDDKERCLREEAALDRAIADKGLAVRGTANFGEGHISRSGMEGNLPCFDVDGVYFSAPARPGEELTYESICAFLDMLVRRGIIGGPGS